MYSRAIVRSIGVRLFLLLFYTSSPSSDDPPATPPDKSTELCWWGKPARTFPRAWFSLSSFVSLSPVFFFPVFFLSHRVRTGGVSGVMDTSDGSLPFATHLSLPGVGGWRGGGPRLGFHTLSLLHVEIGAGVGAGREGGLPAWPCPTRPHPTLIEDVESHILLPRHDPRWWMAAVDGALCPNDVYFTLHFPFLLSSSLFAFLSFPSCPSLFSSLPSAG